MSAKTKPLQKAAVVGAGVIGAGWAARLLWNGVAVTVFDPAPDAARKTREVCAAADIAMEKLTSAPAPKRGALSFAKTAAEAAAGAEWIIESVPENLARKQSAYSEMEKTAEEGALISSSTSGILPSQLQKEMRFPGRMLVAHPFNPVYLLPLVEIVCGEKTDAKEAERAAEYCRFLGMRPLLVRGETPAFIADRILESAWREALWLVKEGAATTAEIDDAIRYGFGIRWAQMGMFETYRAGGGEGGMRQFLAQFAPALKWDWSKLTNTPEMDGELIERIAKQSDEQSGGMSARELERIRDGNLAAVLRALRARDCAAGKTLAEYEKRLHYSAPAQTPGANALVPTLSRTVLEEWTDHNGHMNESRYLECFSEASDELMRLIGADFCYIRGGHSYFTAETHICHSDEARAGERVCANTQVLSAGKKLHLFHRLYSEENGKPARPLATGEHLLLHVDMQTRRACEPSAEVLQKGTALADGHARLPRPAESGRKVGDKPEKKKTSESKNKNNRGD